MCTVGDFNAITDLSEKTGGSSKLKKKHAKFRSFVQRSGLIDLGHSGLAYTWANNQKDRSLILERLDRGMATSQWVTMFPNSKVFHLLNFNSDHLPVLLRMDPKRRKGRKTFKFEHWWTLNQSFEEVCKRAALKGERDWERTCNALQAEVRSWIEGGKNPDKEVKLIEKEMGALLKEDQTPEIRQKIKDLQRNFQHYILQQEAFWLQRSRLNWTLMGDRNTKFYHATTMVRRRRNRISAIQREDGSWAVEEGEVRLQFVNHFKKIYDVGVRRDSDTLINIPEEAIARVDKIPNDPWGVMEAEPTEEDIRWALFALGLRKHRGRTG